MTLKLNFPKGTLIVGKDVVFQLFRLHLTFSPDTIVVAVVANDNWKKYLVNTAPISPSLATVKK